MALAMVVVLLCCVSMGGARVAPPLAITISGKSSVVLGYVPRYVPHACVSSETIRGDATVRKGEWRVLVPAIRVGLGAACCAAHGTGTLLGMAVCVVATPQRR
eukprot:3965587-Pleurochrysis_carterae.AAC.2